MSNLPICRPPSPLRAAAAWAGSKITDDDYDDDDDDGDDDDDDDDNDGNAVYSHGSYFHIYGIMQYAKTHS